MYVVIKKSQHFNVNNNDINSNREKYLFLRKCILFDKMGVKL